MKARWQQGAGTIELSHMVVSFTLFRSRIGRVCIRKSVIEFINGHDIASVSN